MKDDLNNIRYRCFILKWLLLWVIFSGWAFAQNHQELPLTHLTYGYYGDAFVGLDPKDVQVSMQILLDGITEYYHNLVKVKGFVFDTKEGVLQAIRSKKVDLAAINALDYLDWGKKLYLDPLAVGLRNGHAGYAYVLLVRREDQVKHLKDLLQNRIIIQDVMLQKSIPLLWFKTELLKQATREKEIHMKNFTVDMKPARAILPVFFKKVRACIVTNETYETMLELNPQIGKQLKILKKSPVFLDGIMCLVRKMDSRQREFVLDNLSSLQKFPKGEQIINIYKVDHVVRYKPQFMNALLHLIRTYNELSKKYR